MMTMMTAIPARIYAIANLGRALAAAFALTLNAAKSLAYEPTPGEDRQAS
jgi:hypothetical protein